MKMKIKTIVIAIMAIISLTACSNNLKEGDIVFQMSKSKQVPLVQYATGSPWSHCGIIIEKDNKLYVLEASNVVKLTPFQKWKERGRFGIIKSRRVCKKPVHIKYKQYLGIPYDLQFKFDNGKYYCSELVYCIYRDQLKINLCTPKKIKSYNTFGIKDKMKKRGISTQQLAVAPCDLLD